MKKSIFLFAILVSLFSCSKNEDDPTPAKTYDIKGYYQGTLGNGAAEAGFKIAMVIEENGKVTFINYFKYNGSTADEIYYGTYTLSGNQITITSSRLSSPFAVNFTGTFDSATGKLSGSWTNENNYTGKFSINKNITGKDNITGYWKGSYMGIGGTTKYSYCMIVENDGTCSISNNQDGGFTGATISTAYGNYSLGNNVFSCFIRYEYGTSGIKYSLKANNNTTDGKLMDGTWGSENSYTDGGTWTMTKMYY